MNVLKKVAVFFRKRAFRSNPFEHRIMKPGDGDAAESINCRCTSVYEFFDTEAEPQAWLEAGI
jgi:hypothetical protein